MAERNSKESKSVGLAELSQITLIRPIAPAYVTFADYPWLRALLDERERFVGQRRRQWRARLTEPLSASAPAGKLRVAIGVLNRFSKDKTIRDPSPRQLRAAVFRASSKDPCPTRALEHTATQLGLTPDVVKAGLFCDLPDERIIAPLPAALSPAELALMCNEAIVFSLLQKALRVRILAHGNVRAVVRHAKLMGLLCAATPGSTKDEVTLELSGPYTLFRHTRIYGAALASLIPRLAWCIAFRLEADCLIDRSDSQIGRLVLRSGDPIASGRELPRFDSQVEERFARAFGSLACDWDIIREPRPVPVGDTLIFPDFELIHRGTGARWLLEVIGYWTPEYVARKLSMLRAARLERMIICIDEERACADGALNAIGHVVRYKRRVDPYAVIAIVDPPLFGKLQAAGRTKGSARNRRGRKERKAK